VQANRAQGPVVWPLLLTLIGVVLLLDNFLLLEPFNVTALWPLLLVVAGAVILLRGDFLPDDATRNFSITRGNVESGALTISAGEIDVKIAGLDRDDRLIAGQYAANARPAIDVDDKHTHLHFDRAATDWMNFADWELALARDLPWQLFISTSIGEVDAHLDEIISDGGVIATGLGDIRLTTPLETLVPLVLRSAVGNIRVTTPIGYQSRITVAGARTFGVRVDERRYVQVEPNLYIALDADPDAPLVDLHLSGTFGNAYLA